MNAGQNNPTTTNIQEATGPRRPIRNDAVASVKRIDINIKPKYFFKL